VNINLQQLNDTLLAGIRRQMQAQADASEQISSGRRFSRPEQDGPGYRISLDIRHAQKGILASLDAVKTAKARLGAGEHILSQMLPIIRRAQALAIQQASATQSNTERLAAEVEVSRLQEQLLSLANSKYDGAALFAGTATGATAITLDSAGNAKYNGNTQDRLVAITPEHTVTTNVRADNAAFSQMFAAINSLRTALGANDAAGIQNAIGALNSAGDAAAGLTAEIGGRLHAVDIQKRSLLDMKSQLELRLNSHEAASVAEVATHLAQAQNALQAAYATVARLNTLSLVNFLR